MQCGLFLQAIVLLTGKTLRVHAPNTWVLGIWVTVIMVQVWGTYMIIGYLDPEGKILTETLAAFRSLQKTQFSG